MNEKNVYTWLKSIFSSDISLLNNGQVRLTRWFWNILVKRNNVSMIPKRDEEESSHIQDRKWKQKTLTTFARTNISAAMRTCVLSKHLLWNLKQMSLERTDRNLSFAQEHDSDLMNSD